MTLVDTNFLKVRRMQLFLFLELEKTFCHFPRVSGFKVSPQICPQLLDHKDYAHENWRAESHLAMGLFFPEFFEWRNVPFENCTLRFGPKDCVPFRSIELALAARCPGTRNLIAWEFFNSTFTTIRQPLCPNLH